MFAIVPYSTDLRVYSKPYVTYAVTLLCIAVFYFQATSPDSFTEKLMYYPDTLNPFTMLTSALSHGSLMHILFNLIFFMAFSPAVEVVINDKRKFALILIIISVIVSLSYAISVLVTGGEPIPTLGLSGVVTGTIGLSAYLLPRAKIKVFVWFVVLFKTIYLPVWIVAIWYIGGDTWDLLSNVDRGNTNVIAHVAGGFAGYFIGMFYLKNQRDGAKEEIEEEIENARRNRLHGNDPLSRMGDKKQMQRIDDLKKAKQEHAKFESQLHQLIRVDNDSEAIQLILENYDIQKDSIEIYEELFETIKEWGNSRALFCVARLLINLLLKQNKMAKALMVTEQCLKLTDRFIVANSKHVFFLANQAKENHQYELAYNIIRDSYERYHKQVSSMQCGLMEIELLTQFLNLPLKAQWKIDEFLETADGDFKQELLRLKSII